MTGTRGTAASASPSTTSPRLRRVAADSTEPPQQRRRQRPEPEPAGREPVAAGALVPHVLRDRQQHEGAGSDDQVEQRDDTDCRQHRGCPPDQEDHRPQRGRLRLPARGGRDPDPERQEQRGPCHGNRRGADPRPARVDQQQSTECRADGECGHLDGHQCVGRSSPGVPGQLWHRRREQWVRRRTRRDRGDRAEDRDEQPSLERRRARRPSGGRFAWPAWRAAALSLRNRSPNDPVAQSEQHVGQHPGGPGRARAAAGRAAESPTRSQTSTSSSGQGSDIATAARPWLTSSRRTAPGDVMDRSTVGSGAKPLKPTVE